MMNNDNKIRLKKALLGISFLAALTSCKQDFLEITPKGKLIAQKTSDYSLALNNLALLNMSTDAQAAMSDEVASATTYFDGASLRTQRLFRWDDVIYEPDEDAAETKVPMQDIYIYNKIINEVPNATDGTAQENLSIQAEALAGRAWTNFLLINYYGKPYNEATAATDPGYPLVTAADVTISTFKRASVKEVYASIVSDLEKAIPALPAQTTHRLRMSKAAAEALLGKVYMFMGKHDLALPLLNAAFTDLANAAINVRLYDYNVTFATGGVFLPIGTFGPAYPTAPNNEENIYAKQFTNNWTFANNELVLSPQALALYKSSDLRLNFYAATPYPSGSTYPAGMLRRMGPGATQFGVIVPELYLLRAECKARLNDFQGAVTDVEALRANRMPAADKAVPAASATAQKPLLQFIFEERIREFAMQGFRWFDMRRLSVDPLFTTPVYTHSVYNTTGVSATYTLRPERLTMRISPKLINQNPGMENNP